MKRGQILGLLSGVLVLVFASSLMAQVPGGTDPHPDEQGVSPDPTKDPVTFSVDEGSIGLVNPSTTWDANDLVNAGPPAGIIPSAHFFMSDAIGIPPAGSHVMIANPWQMGLLATYHPSYTVTNDDNIDAASLGCDYFSGGGDKFGGGNPGEDVPFLDRMGHIGQPIIQGGNPLTIQFSVNRSATGMVGSAVNLNSTTRLTPAGSVYQTTWPLLAGTNNEVYSPTQLALTDQDDLDAFENYITEDDGSNPPPGGDPNADMFDMSGLDDGPNIFFSVDRDSRGQILPTAAGSIASAVNVQAGLGHAAGDVFVSVQPAGQPGMNLLLITETQLGLSKTGVLGQEDDLDAMVLNLLITDDVLQLRIDDALLNLEQGTGAGVTTPLLDSGEAKIFFSVKEGSIGLMNTAVDWEHRIDPSEESGDVFFSDLSGMNWLSLEATSLGLLETDELNALDTTAIPEPGTLMLLGSGLLGLTGAVLRRRMF